MQLDVITTLSQDMENVVQEDKMKSMYFTSILSETFTSVVSNIPQSQHPYFKRENETPLI